MAKIETWFTQDLNTAVKPRSFPGEVFNNDSLGNLIGVEVTKDGEPFDLTGSVNGYCVLSNGETIPVAGSRSGNKASIVLPQTAYSVRGIIKITLKLTNGNETTTLLQVVGAVDQSVTGNMVNPGSVVQDWSQQIAAALQEIQDAEDNFVRVDTDAQGLTETKKRNGRTNIDAASVSDVDDLRSATENEIAFVGGNIIPIYGYDYQSKYLDADGVPQTGNAWAITGKISLSIGETYKYNGITYTSTNARCFYYNESDAIVGTAFYLNTNGGEITVPSGVTYARFTVCRTEGDDKTFSLNKKYGTLKNDVEIVGNDFDNVANGLYANNLYNSSGNVQGYLDATATIVPGNAWRVTALIPVVPGFRYIYNGITMSVENRSNCFFYDTKGQPIVSTAFLPVANDYGILNVPIGAYYVRFTLNNQAGDPNTFVIRLFVRQTECTSVVTVSPDGTKDYRTINEAYAYAYTIQSKEHPVTILIYPGTYNEVLECTPANDSPYVWGAYISFIGVNQKDVIWRNDSGLYKNSPLHTSNPCLIKNITFIATHDDDPTFESTYADYTADNQQNYGAYGLHLDDPSNRTDLTGEEYETIVEDCTIISKQHAAIGAGMRAGQTLIIRNCRLLMEIPDALRNSVDSTKGALLFHRILGTSDTFIQNLIIDTCNIETNMDKAIYTHGSGGGFKVDFIRNFVWSEIGGAANDIIRGPVGMITTKSYGNNVAALNKTTI